MISSKNESLPTYILQYEQLRKNECVYFNIQNHYNSFVNNVYHFAISYEQSLKHNEYLNNALNNVKSRFYIKRICLKNNKTMENNNIYDICSTYYNYLYTYDPNNSTYILQTSNRNNTIASLDKGLNYEEYYSNYVNDYLQSQLLKKKRNRTKSKENNKCTSDILLSTENDNPLDISNEYIVTRKMSSKYYDNSPFLNEDYLGIKSMEYKHNTSIINDSNFGDKNNYVDYTTSYMDGNNEIACNYNYLNYYNNKNHQTKAQNDISFSEKTLEEGDDELQQ